MDSNSWISSPETVEYFWKMQFGSHPWILMSRIIVTSTPSVLFLAPLFKFALCLIHHWWLPTDTLAIKPLAPGTGIWLFFWFCPEIDILGNLQPWSHTCHIIRCPTQDPPRDIHCLIWLPSSLILQAPSILWERLPWLGQMSPLSHSDFVCNCTSVQESCLHDFIRKSVWWAQADGSQGEHLWTGGLVRALSQNEGGKPKQDGEGTTNLGPGQETLKQMKRG